MTGFFQDRHPRIAFVSLAIGVAVVLSGLFAALRLASPLDLEIVCCGHPLTTRGGGIVDRTEGPDRCPLHDVVLGKVIVPIHYGLLSGPVPTPKESARFPFGEEWLSGGCCLEPSSPVGARILQCPECVLSRREWFRRRGPAPPHRAFPTLETPELSGRLRQFSPLPIPDSAEPAPLPAFLLDPLASAENFSASNGFPIATP